MNDFVDSMREQWEELSTEDQAYFIKSLGLSVGQFLLYKILRKMDAPRWAAYGLSLVASNAAIAPDRFAFEQRKRVRDASKRG